MMMMIEVILCSCCTHETLRFILSYKIRSKSGSHDVIIGNTFEAFISHWHSSLVSYNKNITSLPLSLSGNQEFHSKVTQANVCVGQFYIWWLRRNIWRVIWNHLWIVCLCRNISSPLLHLLLRHLLLPFFTFRPCRRRLNPRKGVTWIRNLPKASPILNHFQFDFKCGKYERWQTTMKPMLNAMQKTANHCPKQKWSLHLCTLYTYTVHTRTHATRPKVKICAFKGTRCGQLQP